MYTHLYVRSIIPATNDVLPLAMFAPLSDTISFIKPIDAMQFPPSNKQGVKPATPSLPILATVTNAIWNVRGWFCSNGIFRLIENIRSLL